MTKRNVLVAATAVLALGATALGSSVQRARAADESWQDVTLIYAGDVKGKI